MILNLNIGILGHVDSGKTSLAKSLSQISSTAAFDKNPQSQERGITLDLGFSAYVSDDLPEHLKSEETKYSKLQFTFVDCPGHASLIRTIIGGSQIIDLMVLVIDINKGIQTQTAECLVIGELTCKKMIVVLNKIDTLEVDKKQVLIDKMETRISKTLSTTIFAKSPIISLSTTTGENLKNLIDTLSNHAYLPQRTLELPFLFAVDHCFTIKGKGTIFTGTVLQGKINVNEEVEIPKLDQIKKVKSMQMFHKPVTTAEQGDRVGMCLTQFDADLMERGILCRPPGYASKIYACVMRFNRIKYFRGKIESKSKFHISIGHETVMANILLFQSTAVDDNTEYFNWKADYSYLPAADEDSVSPDTTNKKTIFILLEFEKPVLVTPNCLIIGSKFDLLFTTSACRLAFWGKMDSSTTDKNYTQTFLPKLKVFKERMKEGKIQRIVKDDELIAINLFKKNTNTRQLFLGKQIQLSTGEIGYIDSTFGTTSKVKLRFNSSLNEETVKNISTVIVSLKFKKYIFVKTDKIIQ